MHFGIYVKELRNKAGLSQRDLAELSNISNAEISRIETGNRQNISIKSIQALAPHLGVSIEHLIHKAGYSNDRCDTFIGVLRQQVERIHEKDSELIDILYKIVDISSKKDIDTVKKVLSCFIITPHQNTKYHRQIHKP
jgi:transcriptional regulator with XRE-family HTH domain